MSHWNNYNAWDKVQPPFKVNQVIVDQFAKILGLISTPKRIATLGCTKEFIQLGEQVVAYEINKQQVDRFPGIAIQCDWNDLDLPDGSYDAVIGDGSLNFLEFPGQWVNVIQKCRMISKTKVICRVFETPATPITLEEIVTRYTTFDCLRLDLMFYMANIGTDVPIKNVLDLVYHVRNKKQMSQDEIAIIENYRGSDVIYRFPTEEQIVKRFPDAIRVPSTGYSMAENCPFYIF